MKKLLLVLSLLCCAVFASAEEMPPDFNFGETDGGLTVPVVVRLIYTVAMKGSYVIDPEVLTDQRLVSFRYKATSSDIRPFVLSFFDSLGLTVVRRGGVDFVSKKKPSDARLDDSEVFVYRPKYRDLSYLTRLLSPLLKGQFTVNRAVALPQPSPSDKPVPDGSVGALLDQASDVMVYSGSPADIAILKKLLPQVDDREGEVVVRAAVYEVSTGSADGSAFSLALNLLGGKLSLASGVASPLETFARFKSNTIDAVVSALESDNRFKVVSTPSLRVRSGKTGRLKVGADVPVLGSITYPVNGGAPVQSVERVASGVIFNLSPVVRDAVVDLHVRQEVSNFVGTSTGVSSSPTKIIREVDTDLSLTDGEIVVLGGLSESKESQDRKGLSFLPSFLRDRSNSQSKTEIILVLQVTKL